MIGAFTFNTSQRIVFENGSAAKLDEHAASFLWPRPFLVTDPGILSLNLQGPCEVALQQAGYALARYSDVVADPPRALVETAVEAARAHGATSVIGFWRRFLA